MKSAKIVISALVLILLPSSLLSMHQRPRGPIHHPGDEGFRDAKKQKKLNESFLLAAKQGDTKSVEQLIPRVSIDVTTEAEGYTALHLASLNGHEPVVTQLLNAGANKDAQEKKGNTALMLAAFKESIPVVQALLNAGAGANLKNKDGRTAFYCTWNIQVKNILKPYTEFTL